MDESNQRTFTQETPIDVNVDDLMLTCVRKRMSHTTYMMFK